MQKSRLDYTIADYTTGTISDATNGSKTITGSGTSWTSAMIGRYFMIATTTGDGVWYKITAVASTTSLTLEQPYNGTSIAAGSASYTIRKIFYDLPYDYEELINVTVQVGSNLYTPKECPTREFWDQINQVMYTSDYPEWFYIYQGQIGFYPIASSAGRQITYNYNRTVADISMADYTTGTVTATNGSTTITGSGTTFTAPMAGRWLKITPTDTAGASGDGIWYQIDAVASATSLTLVKAYQGATVSSGTAYIIGQMSILPDPYQDLPVYDAAALYYSSIKPEGERYQMFSNKYNTLHAGLIADHSQKTTDVSVHDEDVTVLNPNLVIWSN